MWIIGIIVGALIGVAIERWRDRRRHNKPVLYTNGRWLYTKDRRDTK